MPRSLSLLRACALTLALCAPLSGCQLVLGIGNEEPLQTGGAGGTGGSGGTGATGAVGGTGGTGGTGGGTGGSGPCDGQPCAPWEKVILGAVYGGPVDVDAQGNVVIAVFFTEGVDLGDGDPVVPVGFGDIALIKYDRTGAFVWKKVFPAADSQEVKSLDVDAAGNIAIGGDTTGQLDLGKGPLPPGAFVAKLDPDGNTLWSIGAASAAGPASVGHVALDSKGNVLAGGNGGSINFGGGALSSDPQSFYIAKLDGATGQEIWAKITLGSKTESLVGLKVDSSDSPILTGQWTSAYLSLTEAGNTPPLDVHNSGGEDAIFLLRLDPDGNKSNSEMIAGQNAGFAGYVNDLGVDKFGWSILIGGFSGVIQFSEDQYDAGLETGAFVLRDQTTSFEQWTHGYVQASTSASLGRVAIDGSDNIVIVGWQGGGMDLGGGPLSADAGHFVLELDKEGAFRSQRQYVFGDGGIQNVAAGSLEDETVVVGSFYGTADLGSGLIEAPQGFFITRFTD